MNAHISIHNGQLKMKEIIPHSMLVCIFALFSLFNILNTASYHSNVDEG